MSELCDWRIQPLVPLPSWLLAAVRLYLPDASGQYAAQVLWQRGIQHPDQIDGFINYQHYQPTSPFAFGEEMEEAVLRLQQAVQSQEKVAIWGDFDADGLTATAVLWDGLGEFFLPDRLTYFVPNRLTESHGLSISGIDALAAQDYRLIVTCDTGSTCLTELDYAQQCGIDVIVTDHHTLPIDRPPVIAIINPRSLPSDHPFAHLSGVAVAYKLVEALYQTLPDMPQRPLANLLDLVAIGLIADLVNLTGECRYLGQIGIAQLQKNQDPIQPPRPGIAKLLELCRRSGDRPTDISFGLGPRINAISRIQGDARFCVELLTSQDRDRCQQLALETELANTRRRALQREVIQQVKAKLADLDLSTTRVIVLVDAQWPIGILGLVAGQIAQEYNRPTILLCIDETAGPDQSPPLARGSARSIAPIDLYDLLEQQKHLLHRFGGHPLAGGLSLPVEHIPLFTEAVNQQLRSQSPEPNFHLTLVVDLIVTVAELGKGLFQELKLLEPCGMGNPVPKLLIQNCWFSRSWHRKLKDLTGQKLEYLKTEFELRDDSCIHSFPGVWWGHYKDELPIGRCDAIVELDFNSYEDAKRQKRYEVRLIAVCKTAELMPVPNPQHWLIDRRHDSIELTDSSSAQGLQMHTSPASWAEFYAWCCRAQQTQQPLVLAYSAPVVQPPQELWQQLVGIAKYLSRTGKTASLAELQEKLNLGDRSLQIGFETLQKLGFEVKTSKSGLQIFWEAGAAISATTEDRGFIVALEQFTQAIQEEQFMRQYFYQAPLALLQTAADRHASSSESNGAAI